MMQPDKHTLIIQSLKGILKDIIANHNLDREDVLEIPDLKFGDLASNILFVLSRIYKDSPQKIFPHVKEQILSRLKDRGFENFIKDIVFLEPGFINFFFKEGLLYSFLEEIQNRLKVNLAHGESVILEFVSANPTGPLTVAHGRQAAVGDSLARILEFTGFNVRRQYYLNDEGRQIELLGASLKERLKQLKGEPFSLPQDGYQGEYLLEIGRRVLEGNKVYPQEESFFSEFALKEILSQIKGELERFRVSFDDWVSQKKIREEGWIDKVLDILKSKGLLYEKDGALWLRSQQFGDDKDRVVVKSDGSFTYLAPDIAYHYLKFRQVPHLLVNLWGPDHHGYINRLKASLGGLGFDAQKLKIIIVQQVSIKKEGRRLPMSTRKGQFLTLSQIIEDIGVDAARIFYLLRKTSSHLEFDIDLAKAQTKDNPVYYIQYAHARIESILRKAEPTSQAKLDLLKSPQEISLLRFLFRFPQVLELCATLLDPYYLVDYLMGLAGLFHNFYEHQKVLGEDKDITNSRIFLCQGVKKVLSAGLSLLGVSSPERM